MVIISYMSGKDIIVLVALIAARNYPLCNVAADGVASSFVLLTTLSA